MKKILNYIKNNYPSVPINDYQAYQHYYDHNDVYNKLLLSQLQQLDCAPIGITPIEFPVIVKPIINLKGMSNGFKVINNADMLDHYSNIGMFWQKYLNGVQYNLDLNVVSGKIIQYFCVISHPEINGRFKYHYYNKEYILDPKLINLIEKLLLHYTGFVNVEIIDKYIIEMHLRLNGDLFIYNEKNIDDMVKGKIINIENKCFFPIFIHKDNYTIKVKNKLNKFMNSIKNKIIDFDIDNIKCNEYIRICYFTTNSLNNGIKLQESIYNLLL